MSPAPLEAHHAPSLAKEEFDLVPLVRMMLDDGRSFDCVRFVPDTSLAYPANEAADAGNTDGRMRLCTRTIGLLGAMGPMPFPYTELASSQALHDEHALLDLIEVFHHPLAKLLFRAHLASRFWLQHGLPRSTAGPSTTSLPGEQAFTRVICALVGTLGCAGDVSRGLPMDFVLHYAGLLRRRPIPASNLTAMLSDYFGATVTMEQFTGGFLDLPPEECSHLGADDVALGATALIGDRVHDPSSDLTLRIGPVRRALFLDLLPCGEAATVLTAATRFALGPTQGFSYTLELCADDVPSALLVSATVVDADAHQRLGLALWLRNDDTPQSFTSGPFRVAPMPHLDADNRG